MSYDQINTFNFKCPLLYYSLSANSCLTIISSNNGLFRQTFILKYKYNMIVVNRITEIIDAPNVQMKDCFLCIEVLWQICLAESTGSNNALGDHYLS